MDSFEIKKRIRARLMAVKEKNKYLSEDVLLSAIYRDYFPNINKAMDKIAKAIEDLKGAGMLREVIVSDGTSEILGYRLN